MSLGSRGTLGKSVQAAAPTEGIPSNPPSGKNEIQNIFWDPDTKELAFDIKEV